METETADTEPTVTLAAIVPLSLAMAVRARAAAEDRSIASLLRRIITEYLDREEDPR